MEKLLFPEYLFFISDNVELLVNELKSVPDFIKVLGDRQKLITLYSHEIDFLQKYTNGNKILEISCGFLEGDKLVATDGPLKNYQGKIVHIDRHKRLATLEMDFLGRIVRITVGLEVVRKA